MKKLSILGSTGSIGTQALDIISTANSKSLSERGENEFEIVALSAGRNVDLFRKQIKEFKPKFISVLDEAAGKELASEFPETTVLKDIKEIAGLENIDLVISAIVGIAGLEANLIALKTSKTKKSPSHLENLLDARLAKTKSRSWLSANEDFEDERKNADEDFKAGWKRVAIANKETLVAAGHIVKDYCKKYGTELIPIDSEHVAIHQCLSGIDPGPKDKSSGNAYFYPNVKKVLLTSSGGPFRTLSEEKFLEIKLEDALKHPRWSMGPKITIDSSTLMNKGLEVIELNALFNIDYDRIQVVIHPQSIVHSAVSFIDGNTLAQLGSTDMRVPIQYAIDYPRKREINYEDDFDIFNYPQLEFYRPDFQKFPCLKLAYEAGKKGHSYPGVLNSANEIAVEKFMKGEIHYLDIAKIVEKALEEHKVIENPSLEEILRIHQTIDLFRNAQ